MKNKLKIILVILIVAIIGTVYYFQATSDNSIKGCYVAHLANDVYTLRVLSQEGESIEGKLDINNAQKDSSYGTLKGTYKDEILEAEYTFWSEGTESVNAVIFKKVGDTFIRGFGMTDETGTRFTNLNNINFDSSVIYYLSEGDCPVIVQ